MKNFHIINMHTLSLLAFLLQENTIILLNL